jgi:hypothetical protein
MPIFEEFYLVVNQNGDFWYEEVNAGEEYECGYDGYFSERLLDFRKIGTSSVIPVVHFKRPFCRRGFCGVHGRRRLFICRLC